MKTEHAKEIAEAATDIGLNVTHRDGYSGRGMYGEETDGVVGSIGDIIQAIASAAYQYGQAKSESEGEEFLVAMGNLKFDSMGRGQIVY